MKFNHTVSHRNELVREAYHASQTHIESLVRKHKYILLQYRSSVSCRQMTWQHIVSRWNFIITYRVKTNSCGMHIKQDKYESSVWCGNIDTYRYNTHRLSRADIWYDSISCRIKLDMTLYHTVSCPNELVRDAYHAGQIRIECLVRKHRYISSQYISSVSCRQITW